METRTYSAIYRIMHWAIALCMLFLLLTIFLRMGWMNKDGMAEIMKGYVSENNLNLTDDQLIDMSRKIRGNMWKWHIYTGYVLIGLYSIRFLLPFLGHMKFSNPLNKNLSLKEKFQFWTYLIFYICVTASLITGFLVVNGPNDMHETMEEIHVLSIYYLLAFIFLHFGGVFLAEMTDQKGIVSRIISGDKNKNSAPDNPGV